MNSQSIGRQAAVGFVITLALVLLASVILVVGQERRLFSAKAHFATNFGEVLGLKPGSPVYMGGVQIGSVDSIELPTDPAVQYVPVGLAVDRQYSDRIREGTKAQMSFLQLLSGDKLIILTPGDPDLPALEPGSTIPRDESAGIFEAGTTAATNLSQVTESLNQILAAIDEGEGLIGKMIKDPEFGEEGLTNINDAFVEATRVLESVNKGEGLVGQLINDRVYARETLDSLSTSLAHIESVLDRIDRNEGAVGSLLEDGGEGEQAIAETRLAVSKLNSMLDGFQESKGLAGRLIYDEALSDQVAGDLERASSSLASILEKIDRGEGSLGALVNDRAVYEGLEDIVAGVNRSRVGKAFLRHYEKKGRKSRLSSEEKEGGEGG